MDPSTLHQGDPELVPADELYFEFLHPHIEVNLFLPSYRDMGMGFKGFVYLDCH